MKGEILSIETIQEIASLKKKVQHYETMINMLSSCFTDKEKEIIKLWLEDKVSPNMLRELFKMPPIGGMNNE